MVFQEPMTSLNPLHRIGRQVGEAMALHGRRPSRAAVAALLDRAASPTRGAGWTRCRTSCRAGSGSA